MTQNMMILKNYLSINKYSLYKYSTMNPALLKYRYSPHVPEIPTKCYLTYAFLKVCT